MILKRIYKRDSSGGLVQPPTLDYVSVGHTGVHPEQNFSPGLVLAGVQEGWIKIEGEYLILNVHPEPLRYKILRLPGRYCCHCGEKLPDDDGGELSRIHLAQYHLNVPSPDSKWQAGYMRLNEYQCTLDAGQHERFRFHFPGRVVQFPRKEASNG